jgi:DNA (cytosine-5)-methyltransferase 1
VRFGSLFSGIGGLDLGLERAGLQCAWQVEREVFCLKVLNKHWPDVPKFGDVRVFGGPLVRKVDLIAGGFPCQGVSQNGKQKGLEDERSGLWSEFRRIVHLLRPNYVLVENVVGLKARGLSTVLGDLVALGYDACWDCLPAKAFGAPHQRDRLFVVAYLPDAQRSRLEGDAVQEGAVGQAAQWQAASVFRRPAARCSWWDTEPDVLRVVDGPASGMDKDRLRALGNAVVPQVGEHLGRLILEHAEARRNTTAGS